MSAYLAMCLIMMDFAGVAILVYLQYGILGAVYVLERIGML